jgi:hypothetical protein
MTDLNNKCESTMNEKQFTTMFYNNRHLVIKTIEGKQPFVIAECYLHGTAETICEALTELQNKSEQDDETEKNAKI